MAFQIICASYCYQVTYVCFSVCFDLNEFTFCYIWLVKNFLRTYHTFEAFISLNVSDMPVEVKMSEVEAHKGGEGGVWTVIHDKVVPLFT